MLIKPGTIDDFEAIDSFDPFGGDRKGELHDGRCHVATQDGCVIGYISFSFDGFIGKPFISFLAVAEEYRRQKIATKLIEHAERKVGNNRVFISTEDTNQDMLLLLKNMNWTDAGSVQGINDDGSAEVFFYRDTKPNQVPAG